jgi:hypothetical protein
MDDLLHSSSNINYIACVNRVFWNKGTWYKLFNGPSQHNQL